MTIQNKLESAVAAVENVLAHHQAIYVNGIALIDRAELARSEFMLRIQATSGDGTPLNIAKGHPEIENILGMDASARYLSAQGIALAVTSSPEFLEAKSILEPLVAEVRKLEAKLAAEIREAAKLASEKSAALEAAKARAIAEIEAEFAAK